MPFQAIIGQNKAITLLGRALAGKRFGHSYLFSGPQGVGKKSTALALVASIFCRNAKGGKPCGRCDACVKLRADSHPDFLRLRPEGTAIKIDQIRALKQASRYPPLEAPLRITLLEETQTMRREAANSLLKLLEEPPPDNLLLLMVDGTLELLPPTIVSRCQLIPFAPLPRRLVEQVLREQLLNSSEAHIQELAVIADGCPGQVLDGSIEGVLEIYKRLLQRMLKREGKQAQRVESALAMAGSLPEDDEQMERLLHLLRVFLKNVMIAGMTPELDPSVEVAAARERWNPREISAKIQAVDLMEQALAGNCNRTLSAEVLLLTLLDCTHPALW